MKILLISLILIFPFLQGCSLAGAYIYFGDQAWANYIEAKKNHQDREIWLLTYHVLPSGTPTLHQL